MKKTFAALVIILVITACSEKVMQSKTNKGSLPPSREWETKPTLALALGGGAFHGPAHVGVIKALEEEGVRIDFIAGTSAGSLVGAMYADHQNADSLMVFIDTKARQIFDFSLFRSRQGFISGKKLQKYIRENCRANNIEELKIPFAAVTTDLVAGESITLTSGPLAPAINASCAIPFIFEPVRIYGKVLVDGGVLNNVPADVCRDVGASVVIAVDIMALGDTPKDYDNKTRILMRSLGVASGKLKASSMAGADLVIKPDLRGIPYMSGTRNRDAFDSGYTAAKRAIPEIKKLISNK